ncbi:hypothetical protein SDJN02_10486, partial [Cucurbita argyrosperma subsp. argyrosperma]
MLLICLKRSTGHSPVPRGLHILSSSNKLPKWPRRPMDDLDEETSKNYGFVQAAPATDRYRSNIRKF